ncbi:MAG TPA: C-GCAxxG-C-C family protein [Candidatus Sulfotelmatobacter sp.]|nr:C-GCAxxG-C-C family protein [Candidatus Sulfotelmatobacter sp.]HWI57539.1 C-GCAxxG-C-C family protein [Bacillota bacterium]
MKEHALAVFRRPPERLNCAQAVLHAYREVSGNKTIPLAGLKPFGGGRAPGGLCGALHAACIIAPDKTEALRTQFAQRLGSTVCEELREARQYACESCVAQAAELLEIEAGGLRKQIE